jgi:hypothetical protein
MVAERAAEAAAPFACRRPRPSRPPERLALCCLGAPSSRREKGLRRHHVRPTIRELGGPFDELVVPSQHDVGCVREVAPQRPSVLDDVPPLPLIPLTGRVVAHAGWGDGLKDLELEA